MQETAPQPPAAPSPPSPPSPPAQFEIPVTQEMLRGASPTAVLTAARAQRSELRDQLENLEDRRDDITRELTNEATKGVDRQGLEARLKEVDARISATEAQIAQADQAVAAAAAVPGAVQITRPPERNGPPEEIVAIPIVFTLAVLMPLALAYSRRIWKRGATVVAPVSKEVTDRLESMGQTIESIALEVERIGEGQRFLTRVMSDKGKQLGVGAAEPIAVPQVPGEQVAVPRYER